MKTRQTDHLRDTWTWKDDAFLVFMCLLMLAAALLLPSLALITALNSH